MAWRMASSEPVLDEPKLQNDDLLDLPQGQRLEEHGLVHPIQELGPEDGP